MMADWDVVEVTPLATKAPPISGDGAPFVPTAGRASNPTPGQPLYLEIPGRGTQQTKTTSGGLPPEARDLYGRVRKAEGTAAGDGYVFYGGQSFKPGKDFPEWDGMPGPQGKTHASGPGQWEPDTWNGLKPDFEKRFGRGPDFSSDADQEAMTWLNAGKVYPGGEEKLREDIKAGKLNTSALSAQWQGFKSPSDWAVTQKGKWSVADRAVAFEQGRSNTSVVWMSPEDYLGMTPEPDASETRPRRQSLAKSLALGQSIEDIPSLEAKVEKNGRIKLFDQDGRNRAMVAKEEGVDLIPVAVHGVGKDIPDWIEDMRGNVRRFDFQPAPKAGEPPVSIMADQMRELGKPADQAAANLLRARQPSSIPTSFPADAAGIEYGQILPYASNPKTKEMSLAAPEMLREPVRSVLEMGERALGYGEQGQDPLRTLTGAQFATLMAGAGGRGVVPPRAPAPVSAPVNALGAISRERAGLAQEALRDFNIPITAADVGGNPTIRAAQSAVERLPFSGAAPAKLAQRQAFNREVSRTFGEDAPAITQTVMDRAKKRIGSVLNRIEKSNDVRLDNKFIDELAEAETLAESVMVASEYGVIKRQIDNAIHQVRPGDTISGKAFADLMHHGSPLDRAAESSNSNIAYSAQQIAGALRGAMQRSLKGEDLVDYRAARFQYKNMKAIEPLVNKSPEGNISPALLNERVSAEFPNRAYDTSGTNKLDRLAKIGQAFLKEPGSSMTSERSLAVNALKMLGEVAAAAAAGHFLGIPLALGSTAASLAVGRIGGAYLRSPGLAERSINRTLNPGGNALRRMMPNSLPSPNMLAPAVMPPPSSPFNPFNGGA